MKNEDEIIQEIINGADYYEELVHLYHVGLIIHCEQLVGDRDDAEDIAQEAFIKAYQKLAKFNPKKARFSTWLYKIATNLAVDFLRAHKRRIVVEDIELVAEATMPAHIEEDEKRELIEQVAQLQPPEFRRVIEAYFWEGKSYQEIADAERIPLNTVRSRLRRAKLQLKERLS
ncbi:MAG TPA: sigma-70 family RNA polymerase sigma factor [Candidatus Saccharimonadales bacterium]|nr:sigma-70 family RNA polymerase sigma factor [Candidatus Saccharimonadales bacterium]